MLYIYIYIYIYIYDISNLRVNLMTAVRAVGRDRQTDRCVASAINPVSILATTLDN